MTTLQLNQIGQIAVNVRDIERAVMFYRDVLGMALQFQVPNMAFFDCGGVRLMLSIPLGKAGGTSVIYYKVDDLDSAHRLLLGNNVQILQEPHLVAKMPDHELWMCFFRDLDENTLALMSEVRD